MELEEAFRRIVGQHWRLIVCFTVVGVAVTLFVHLQSNPTYTASARLVLDTPDPKSRTEAGAIADTAEAIATSPAQVQAALARIGVQRDALNVANELTGVWLRGPYLHNGSVPTLRELLLPPSQRPEEFYRGYDLIDAARLWMPF